MGQLILGNLGNPEQRFSLRKKITTVGSDPNHDIPLQGSTRLGLAFSLVHQPSGFEILPGAARIRLNGQTVSRATTLKSCDRLEWNGGSAVYLHSQVPAGVTAEGSRAIQSLGVLQNLAATLQSSGSLPSALHQTLEALVEMSGAETGYLLSDLGGSRGWEMIASRMEPNSPQAKRKDLFSNTILQEALNRREPVYIENIIGHPWGEAASIIEAKIFSAACFPLCVGERTLGAVFLLTRSPGRSIKRDALAELALLATQAALMMGLQAELKIARQENAKLRTLIRDVPTAIVSAEGVSPMADVARRVSRLAPTPLSVLILGETGTGKEVVARELHRQSPQAQGPFIAINCAAIPGPLLESTLFGHERGAFTGAVRAQPGKFIQAEGGTLLLDEIGDLPLDLQAKLLRALQERQVEPLGSLKAVPFNVRVLAATHQDLETSVKTGRFRQDLYFRLNGATLRLPPLRERKADLPALIEHFLRKLGSSARFSTETLAALERHSWPGNVRELEQAVTRAALLSDDAEIGPADLDLATGTAPTMTTPAPIWESLEPSSNLQEAQLQFTREYVEKTLARHEGHRLAAAHALGISERTLYRILAAGTDKPGGNA